MSRRQSIPEQWLIVDDRPDWRVIRKLPAGNGILVLRQLKSVDLRHLRKVARHRRLVIIHEAPGSAARTHNVRELRRALLHRTPFILLSPIHPTKSHPDWKPMPRMRAASLARLAKRRAIALGGMNARRYAKIAPLGFIAWAGISAFRT